MRIYELLECDGRCTDEERYKINFAAKLSQVVSTNFVKVF